MSFIEAKVTGDDKVIARFNTLSSKLRAELVDSMKRQWFRVQSQVVTDKLSGDPLKRRTGNLASSINVGAPGTATMFSEDPAQIVGRVGTRVRYGYVHENGGTFEVKAHTRQVGPKTVEVRAHSVTFPQRSFLRSTLRDMRTEILEALRADIARSTAGG